MDTEEVALLSVIIACVGDREHVRRTRKRKISTKPWSLKRNELRFYNNLLAEFRLDDEDCYKNYLRMSAKDFDELLSLFKAVRRNNNIMKVTQAGIKGSTRRDNFKSSLKGGTCISETKWQTKTLP